MELAGAQVHGYDAADGVILADQGRHEPLFIDRGSRFHQLLVDDVEQYLAGNVRHVARALPRLAAKGAQVDLAAGAAIEDHAHVLELDDRFRSLAAEHLDGVLVAQVVAALYRIVGVVFPGIVLFHSGVDAALRGI